MLGSVADPSESDVTDQPCINHRRQVGNYCLNFRTMRDGIAGNTVRAHRMDVVLADREELSSYSVGIFKLEGQPATLFPLSAPQDIPRL